MSGTNGMRDPNVVIGAWLEEGPTELPAATRRSIATSIRTINQRSRGFGSWWSPPATGRILRPALLAAAIVVAVGGVYLLDPLGRSRPTGPAASPSAEPTAAPDASPAPPPPLVGRIAFTRYDTDVGPSGTNLGTFIMQADGSGERRLDLPFAADGVVWSPDGTQILLPNAHRDGEPDRPAIANDDGSEYHVLEVDTDASGMWCGAWSPDGTRLLCSVTDAEDPGVDGIYTVAADGTDLQRLTSDTAAEGSGTESQCPAADVPGDFSPDGTRFVFVRVVCGSPPDPTGGRIAAMHVGTLGREETVQVTVPGFVHEDFPAARWSPDGQWILFGGVSGLIYRVRPDGTDRETIPISPPSLDAYLYRPDWSPDGSRIVFTMWSPVGGSELYTVAAEGSHLQRLTRRPGSEDLTSWGPPGP